MNNTGAFCGAVGTLAKNPGFWMANAQTLGNSYESAKAGGAGEVEATATALLNSLLSSAVEVGGGIETLPAALARDTSEAGVRKWVRSMLEEGGEEVVQGVIENMTQMAIYDHDKPVLSMKDEGAVINPGRMAGEFAMGAGVGGILGGGQMLANGALNGAGDGGRPQVAPTGTEARAGLEPAPTRTGDGGSMGTSTPTGVGTTGVKPSAPAGQLPSVGEPRGAGGGPLSPAEPDSSPRGGANGPVDVFGQQKTAPAMGAEKINPGARSTVREQVGDMPSQDYGVPKLAMPQEVTVDAEGNAVTEGKLPAAIRKYIIEKFKGKVLQVGADHKVYIDRESAREFAFPPARLKGDIKTAKMTAGVNLDTTLNPAVFLLNAPDDGHHPEATGGWDNFYVMFETGTGVYSGIVKSKVTERGRVFHDITEIQKEGDALSTHGDNGTSPSPARTASPSSDPILAPGESGVKTQDMQLGGKILLPGSGIDGDASSAVPGSDVGGGSVGARRGAFPYRQKNSRVGENSFSKMYQSALAKMESDGAQLSQLPYDVVSEAQSMERAQERLFADSNRRVEGAAHCHVCPPGVSDAKCLPPNLPSKYKSAPKNVPQFQSVGKQKAPKAVAALGAYLHLLLIKQRG